MTRHLKVDPRDPDRKVVEEAAAVLREGGIVAFPTETVYALAAAVSVPGAVERLREVKRRPPGKPFTYLLPHPALVEMLVDDIPSRAQALMNRYWPGPLTLVLPAGGALAGEDVETVGVRVPADRVALEILHLAEVLVAAPSANPSGEPPATNAEEVLRYFGGQIDLIVDAGTVTLKEPSTVVRVSDKGCEVLREGIITAENVHQLASGRTILFVCTGNTCRSPMAEGLFRMHLARKLKKSEEDLPELGYRIASAGISAYRGSRASEASVEAMLERGCDISRHISQPLTPELLREADRIYAMTPQQLDAIRRLDPSAAQRAVLLSTGEIIDPIGSDTETYRACAAEIEEAVRSLVESF